MDQEIKDMFISISEDIKQLYDVQTKMAEVQKELVITTSKIGIGQEILLKKVDVITTNLH